MKQKIIKLDKRVELVFANSKAYKTTKNDQPQGRIMNMCKKSIALLNKGETCR